MHPNHLHINPGEVNFKGVFRMEYVCMTNVFFIFILKSIV